jgi:hypothetical protein
MIAISAPNRENLALAPIGNITAGNNMQPKNYILKRATPVFDKGDQNDWSAQERSASHAIGALQERVGVVLERCTVDDDFEFVLEERPSGEQFFFRSAQA